MKEVEILWDRTATRFLVGLLILATTLVFALLVFALRVYGDDKEEPVETSWNCWPVGEKALPAHGYSGNVVYQLDTASGNIESISIWLFSNKQFKNGPGQKVLFEDTISEGVLYLDISVERKRRRLATPAFTSNKGSYTIENLIENPIDELTVGLILGRDTSLYHLSLNKDSVIVSRQRAGDVCLNAASISN